MVEYSLDLDIPDHVFEHPIVQAMSDATTDIMTWPNVSLQFLHLNEVTELPIGSLFLQCMLTFYPDYLG